MPEPPPKSADDIFAGALSRPAAGRDAFVAAACGDNGELLAEVLALLAAHEAAPTGFLAEPAGGGRPDARDSAPTIQTGDPALAERVHALLHAREDNAPSPGAPSEKAGDLIGRYKLLQQIGEGGFGSVWMAEQTEPVSRRVALKIIKLGMDTKEVIARFEAERQALAMMDHPNIAKVLDAGATDKGRPFFVMELVKGVPITHYCDETGRGTRERLALFADVCAAIHHAHQKGIIHRDIKPSNVMVTLYADKPIVKVIDFGIAKATQGKLTDKTLFTRFEQFIGTPVYMSPEQAALSAVDIDTRSDIYALGILLYELLTGKPPFDSSSLMSAGYDEMRRIIREVEPPRPSSRLSTVVGEERTSIAKARHIEPERLNKLVEPDLDWIVMKAIEKDRTRRYDSANGLAADIKRFLDDEPVTARPPTALYRFQKAWRRNKVAYTAGIAVMMALVIGLVASILALVGQRRAGKAERLASEMRQAADLSKASAKSIAEVVEGLLKDTVKPLLKKGNRTAITMVMKSADRMLSKHLKDSPIEEFNLRNELKAHYLTPGLFELDEALEQVKHMEKLLPRLSDLSESDRLAFEISAAGLHAITDNYKEGTRKLQSLRSQMANTTPKPSDMILETLIIESDANIIEGNMTKAEQLAREAYDSDREYDGQFNLLQESTVERLANVLLMQGKYADALPYARDSLALLPKQNLPEEDLPDRVFKLQGRVTEALCGIGRFPEAIEGLEELQGSKLWNSKDGKDQLAVLRALVNLAQGRWEDAETPLIAYGLSSGASAQAWRMGAIAAAGKADPGLYSKFVAKGYEYLATADAQSANWLYETLTILPQSPALDEVMALVRERITNASNGWWTTLALLGDARRSIHEGDYEGALTKIDQFTNECNQQQGVAKLVLRQIVNEHRHEYIRAAALANLNKPTEALEAFNKGWEQKQRGQPLGAEARTIVGKYFSERHARFWAAEFLTAKGIEIPSEARLQ